MMDRVEGDHNYEVLQFRFINMVNVYSTYGVIALEPLVNFLGKSYNICLCQNTSHNPTETPIDL